MRTRIALVVLAIVAMLITVFNSICMIYNDFFYSIEDVPVGTYVASVKSPDGTKELGIYRVANSLGEGVRCSVTEGDKTHNVYWQAGCSEVTALWSDDNVHVTINGEIINVNENYYDCRDVIEEIIPIVNLTKQR